MLAAVGLACGGVVFAAGESQTPAAKAISFAVPITVGGQAGWQHDEGHGSGYFHTFDALRLPDDPSGTRKVHVFLPRGYGWTRRPSRRYPVVYMQDGGKVFFSDTGVSWSLGDRLTELYRDGRIPPLIVVGINSPDRDAEYTHAPVPTVATCCRVVDYARYLALRLKPFVDAYYRTDPARSATAVIGSSHGGLAAFVAAARYPDIFGMAGALSPSFWVDLAPFGPGAALADSALLDLARDGLTGAERPRLWIDWGLVRTGGAHNAVIERWAADRGAEMTSLLQSDYGYVPGHDLWRYADPSGEHTEASWGGRIGRVLTAFYGSR